MKKKELSIIDLALQSIKGFAYVRKIVTQSIILRDLSDSTLNNYLRKIATICMHFSRLPENISDDEINEYLAAQAISPASPSRSIFKHTVYGLRFYFRLIGKNKRALLLPKTEQSKSLPTILNKTELKILFKTPTMLKHRIMLALVYSAGLRCQELINLKISDIDFERKTIHIRISKYKKDRIVPLSTYMAKGLKKYIASDSPTTYLFNGNKPDNHCSATNIQIIMNKALKNSGIKKEVCLHSLRHSYATHLLEQGVNIVAIKGLLGHADIITTMIYLQVAQCPVILPHSPLYTLYDGLNIFKNKNLGREDFYYIR